VGWLWYLLLLTPVLGIVQAGVQARADRYTYLSLTGPFIALCWGAAAPAAGIGRRARAAVTVGALALVCALAIVARAQVETWRSSLTVFEHAVAVDPANWIARNNLGMVLARQGRVPEAVAHFEETLRVNPGASRAWYNLGLAALRGGRPDLAVQRLRTALELQPSYPEARNNLGAALFDLGRMREAIPHLEEAGRLSPRDAVSVGNLGRAWLALGDLAQAESCFREALRRKPDYVAAKVGLETVRRRRAAAP
jgi:Flp pilus assembly protein TadD